MATEKPKVTPRDVMRIVFRRRLMFLSGAAAFALVALVGASWWPLKYTGTAKFERRMDAASEDLTRTKTDSFEAVKRTLQHELAGPVAVGEAVEDVDLEKKGLLAPLPRGKDGKLTPEGQMLKQQLVHSLMDNLRVTFDVTSPEVDLVSLTFTDRDARLAQEFPNTLVTKYIERIGAQIISNLTASRDFLQDKVAVANVRLTEFVAKRLDFEVKHAGMLPDNVGALQQQVERVTSDIDTVRRQLMLAKQRLEQVKAVRAKESQGGPAAAPPEGTAAPKPGEAKKPEAEKPSLQSIAEAMQTLERVYREATQEVANLLAEQQQDEKSLAEMKTLNHMTDKHPKVEALRKQIADLADRITKARARVTDTEKEIRKAQGTQTVARDLPTESSLTPLLNRQMALQEAQLAINEASSQAEVQLYTDELERLQNRQKALEDLSNRFGPVRQEYLALMKNVTEQQAEVDRWQKRLTEVQMDLAAEAAKHRTRLRQVVLAEEQFAPSSPQLLYVLAVALLGGLAFGGGMVFLSNTMDRSITNTEEAVSHFGLPVFGVVAEIVTPGQDRRRKLWRWGLWPLMMFVAVLALAGAALNITLWLQYREGYEQWKRAPVTYLAKGASDAVDALKRRL